MNSPSLGYVIFYVADAKATASFWVEAFGCQLRFVHESGEYAELDTGATTLAFVADSLMKTNQVSYRHNVPGQAPAGASVSLVTSEPEALFERALKHGATSIKAIETKPWGQRSGFVADRNGLLVELCSPVEH